MQCWSWEGEDVLVRKIMLDTFKTERGFYVDAGAHHPHNLSNTALLYAEGWRGINIDATPGSMAAFREARPEDVNLELAIGPDGQRLTFVQFDDTPLNGFLTDKAVAQHESRGAKVIGRTEVPCRTLGSILEEHARDRALDLLSIDLEGMDHEVLAGLDLERWRPKLLLLEVLGCSFVDDLVKRPIVRFLRTRDYSLFSRLHFSCLFIDRRAYFRMLPHLERRIGWSAATRLMDRLTYRLFHAHRLRDEGH
jgi:FkbM family methyltransferase